MRRSPAIPSAARATALAALAFALAGAAAGCGGKGKGATTAGPGPAGAAAARLPWEAALTPGASFVLHNDIPDIGDDSITVKVVSVDDQGGVRTYHLDWGEEGPNGPSTIRVDDTIVTIGDAGPEAMQQPWSSSEGGDSTCYAEDYSNPDGCEDVCDAALCLSATGGIVAVSGLYAPNYGVYAQR